jgi:hypothetical protein
MQPTVLLIGKDLELLNIRSLLIQDEGFSTITAMGAETAKVAKIRDVAVVILCHTLNSAEKRKAVESVRLSSPKAMVLHLLKSGIPNELPEHASNNVIEDGPIQLTYKVRDLMQRWQLGLP